MTEAHGLSNGYDSEDEARGASRLMAVSLIESLKEKGFTRFAPPLRDGGFEHGQWDEFADCRILVAWIEPHKFSQYAGKYAVRVDTLARR